MKILVIDNNLDLDCWGSPDLVRYARLAPGAVVAVRRGPHDDLPLDPASYDRIIISGSRTSALETAPWIEHLHDFIRRTVQLRKPLLGVCYGQQALARALGGISTVRKAARPEMGWTKIELIDDSPLTEGLARSFYSFSSHNEEVATLPQGMRPLARSADCAIQACQLKDLPVFGIQFHPEKSLEEATHILAEKKKKLGKKALLLPDSGRKVYDPAVGERIFKNFLAISA
jgi:GMP synthase-like glutamine amidotransferase